MHTLRFSSRSSDIRRGSALLRGQVRRGFTLLELLVVISIIGTLVALLLPAVQNARMAARRTECLNNMRNVTIATMSFLEARRRFPAAGYWAGIPGQRYPSHNWVVDLLPYLDRRDLADRWDYTMPYSDPPNRELSAHQIRVLACPSDDSLKGNGDLSYGVNGGIGYSTFLNNVHDVPVNPFGSAIDLNGDGITGLPRGAPESAPTDRDILKYLGMFFMENYGDPNGVIRHYKPAGITDGFSNTILLIENVRTGRRDTNVAENWATPFANKTAVYFSPDVCPSDVCATGTVDYRMANQGQYAINAGLDRAEGESPFGSSGHTGGLNISFADGSTKFVSEDISGEVYASLFSPAGARLDRTALRQKLLSQDEF